jgi:hypothetical protein
VAASLLLGRPTSCGHRLISSPCSSSRMSRTRTPVPSGQSRFR